MSRTTERARASRARREARATFALALAFVSLPLACTAPGAALAAASETAPRAARGSGAHSSRATGASERRAKARQRHDGGNGSGGRDSTSSWWKDALVATPILYMACATALLLHRRRNGTRTGAHRNASSSPASDNSRAQAR